jgi:hypothetical protein
MPLRKHMEVIMATAFSNIIIPEVFSPYVTEQANVTSRLIASGAVAPSPLLNSFLAGAGSNVTIPSWINPAGVVFNQSNQDPNDMVDAAGVDAHAQITPRLAQNWHVGSSMFNTALAGSNPVESIATQVTSIFNANRQASLVAMLNGLFATGGALESEVVPGETWSSDLVIQAETLFDDFTTGSGLLIVTSEMFAQMRAENLIETVALSDQNIVMPTYLGYAVIVDNKIGTDVDGYLCRPGSILMGTGDVDGHGAGVEYLALRDEYALHVLGTSFVSTVEPVNPSNATLELPASWAAVYPMEQIGVKAIKVSPPTIP